MARHIVIIVVALGSLAYLEGIGAATKRPRWNETKDPRWDEPQGRVFEVESDEDINDLNSDLQPGDVMVMKSGDWSDARITITASGRDETGYRIYLIADVPGEVHMTGKVQIIFEGSNIEVRGVWIDGISDDKITPVYFEEGSSRCRFTNSAITNFNREVHDKKHHWVEAWGLYHTIDYNSFEEKVGTGQIVRVKSPEGSDQLEPGDEPPSYGATIAYNYFGPREDTREDDGEGIQIGLYVTEWSRLDTVVEFNYFYEYDGEIECISVKGSDNIVRYNTFEDSSCLVTLRHGDRNEVEENYFFCDEKDGCGGVRVYGDDHKVTNNYVELEHGNGVYRAGIVLQGAPFNDPYLRPAKNSQVEKNLLVDCDTCIYAGPYGNNDGGNQPENIHYSQNIMTAISSSKYILREYNEGQTNPSWSNNIGYGGVIDNHDEYEYGLKTTNPEMEWDSDWRIYRPTADGLDFTMTHKPLTRNDVGPTW